MLDTAIRDLARGKNFAAFTVLLPSGQPMTHVMWVDATDEHVLINTERHRAKFQAVEADPRVTVMVWDAANPYHYAEVRGTVAGTVGRRRGAAPHRRVGEQVHGRRLRRRRSRASG